MRKVKVLLTTGALMLAAPIAWAQDTQYQQPQQNPQMQQNQQPQQYKQGGNIGDVPDRKFFEKAAEGGMAEVKLGKLAIDKAQNPQVKQFGQRMVDDHGRANDQLKQIASKKQMTMPTTIETKDQALYDKLSKMSGQDFDKAYMQAMVKDHEQDVSDFRKEASQGQDTDLQQFASKTLPTLEDHSRMARDIQSGRPSASPSGTNQNMNNAQPMDRR